MQGHVSILSFIALSSLEGCAMASASAGSCLHIKMLPMPILLIHTGCWDHVQGDISKETRMRGILLALLAAGGEGRRAGLCMHPFYCPELGLRGTETCGA